MRGVELVLKPVLSGSLPEAATMGRAAIDLGDGTVLVATHADEVALLSRSGTEDLGRILSQRSGELSRPLTVRSGTAELADATDLALVARPAGGEVRVVSRPARPAVAPVAPRETAVAADSAVRVAPQSSFLTRAATSARNIVLKPIRWAEAFGARIARGVRSLATRGATAVEDAVRGIRSSAAQTIDRAVTATKSGAQRLQTWFQAKQEKALELWRQMTKQSEERQRLVQEAEEKDRLFQRQMEQHQADRRSFFQQLDAGTQERRAQDQNAFERMLAGIRERHQFA